VFGFHEHANWAVLGKLLRVQGRLEIVETNTEPYGVAIHVNTVEVLADSNAESWHYARALQLGQEDYVQPYPGNQSIVTRCNKKAADDQDSNQVLFSCLFPVRSWQVL
jgi:hypothetical protein